MLADALRQFGARASVGSAGLVGPAGRRGTPHAIEVMAEIGLPIDDHISRTLDDVDLGTMDTILVMSATLRDAVVDRFDVDPADVLLFAELGAVGRLGHAPDAGDADVDDPYGKALSEYRRTRDRLLVMSTAAASALA